MRHRQIITLATQALLVAAVPAVAETFAWHSDSYAYRQFAAVVSGRETRVFVRSNPFAVERRVLERAVVDAIQKSLPYLPTRFTTRPTDNTAHAFKLVFLLNGPPTVTPGDLCAGGNRFHAAPIRARLDVSAALCRGGTAVSVVTASAIEASATIDAQFIRLIADMSRELLPRTEASFRARRAAVPEPTLDGGR